MSATPATSYGTEMATKVANTSGAVNTLVENYLGSGKLRTAVCTIELSAQAAASIIGIARLPVPFVPMGFTLLSDTSLGTATIALGNAGDGNAAKYLAAQTFTATDTPTPAGNTATLGVPVTEGYDCISGAATSPDTAGNGGGGYEDVILTTGTAALPAAGTLKVLIHYALPN